MMKVEAIIREEKLDNLKNALAEAGFLGMTVSEVKGRGRQKGYTLNFRGKSINVDLLPKLKVELTIDDSNINKLVDIIRKNSSTGEIGDGKIFLYPVADAIRIRTGERGPDAI
ncbi:transcriptional regulator [Candidatus Bathyarchaeota archaeon RBG_13_38_9]|nr:MAG: transcriptional regulator [Candidatus Bathyarchaeota archaeon RBG_13_38_9]